MLTYEDDSRKANFGHFIAEFGHLNIYLVVPESGGFFLSYESDKVLFVKGSVTIASACLTGVCCRYDGGHRLDDKVVAISEKEKLIPLCPEQLGGLSIPRPPAEIVGGDGEAVLDGRARVVDEEGRDITGQFLKGAREFLRLAKAAGARKAIMKEKSPSCGVRKIYQNGILVPGKGVSTALLIREGIEVISNEEM